jgi:hypothetical protein
MRAAARDRPRRSGARRTALAFAVLAALTAVELRTPALALDGPTRATTLVGLLILKVALVLSLCLKADFRRRSAARLVLGALALAAGFAAVLMLEAAFQARVR